MAVESNVELVFILETHIRAIVEAAEKDGQTLGPELSAAILAAAEFIGLYEPVVDEVAAVFPPANIPATLASVVNMTFDGTPLVGFTSDHRLIIRTPEQEQIIRGMPPQHQLQIAAWESSSGTVRVSVLEAPFCMGWKWRCEFLRDGAVVRTEAFRDET